MTLTHAWVLEEDAGYEGTTVLGVYTSGEKAQRAVKRIAKDIGKERGLKVQVTGHYESDDSNKVVEWRCINTHNGYEYVATEIRLDRRIPL